MTPFFISIPHSGERIAPETPWLENLPEEILMCDPDRYVDVLYKPVIDKLQAPSVVTEWHRYVVDLNRVPEDIDANSVVGAPHPAGTHPKGFHWSVTTKGHTLISQPMSMELHQTLTEKYYRSFHAEVERVYQELRQKNEKVYHIDAHSMPSVGEKLHRDPGQKRAEIVVSDCGGKSCSSEFTQIVIDAYEKAGFEVAHNWPYVGGRITEMYGLPNEGHHTIQVELNRALYMDEKNKQLKESASQEVSQKISTAIIEVNQWVVDNH